MAIELAVGVTSAQVVPTLSSSRTIPWGSPALRLKMQKLAIWLPFRSLPTVLVSGAGGGVAAAKSAGAGLTHIMRYVVRGARGVEGIAAYDKDHVVRMERSRGHIVRIPLEVGRTAGTLVQADIEAVAVRSSVHPRAHDAGKGGLAAGSIVEANPKDAGSADPGDVRELHNKRVIQCPAAHRRRQVKPRGHSRAADVAEPHAVADGWRQRRVAQAAGIDVGLKVSAIGRPGINPVGPVVRHLSDEVGVNGRRRNEWVIESIVSQRQSEGGDTNTGNGACE